MAAAARSPRSDTTTPPRVVLRLAALLLASLLCVGAERVAEPGAGDRGPDLAELDAAEIARRAEGVLRGDRTYLEARMTVRSARLPKPRVVTFRSWDDKARDRCLIRILAPPEEAGTTFLRLPPNLWTYLPQAEQILRIPSSGLLQPWMGGDFTHDDLVHESSEVEDYDHRLLRIDESPPGHEGLDAYVLESLPREEVAALWGKIIGWIEVEHATPLRRDFYDQEGKRVRTLHFEEIRERDGRRVPHRWIVRPLARPGRETTIELRSIVFDASFEDGIFTPRNLRKR